MLEIHTLNTVLLSDLSSALWGLAVVAVPEGNVGTGLSQTIGHGETNTSTRTGDNGGLALQGEHSQQAGVRGSGGVLMDKVSDLVDGVVRHGE